MCNRPIKIVELDEIKNKMFPSDVKYFEKCLKENVKHCEENKKIVFYERRSYKVDIIEKQDDYEKFRDIIELINFYGYSVNGKKVGKWFGKKKYEYLPCIRKGKETKLKNGNVKPKYSAKDFPIKGMPYGGISLIKDTHNLTHDQWNYNWLSDEEGEMTILDDGTWILDENGFYYDKNFNNKPSKLKKKKFMAPWELKKHIKKQRRVYNRKYYVKNKEIRKNKEI